MSRLHSIGKTRHLWRAGVFLGSVVLAASAVCSAAEPQDQKAAKAKSAEEISGREIFMREWLPNDPRSHGGDGLGPVFNDSSCVACHNQGGAGGGGAASKNVNIVSATFNARITEVAPPRRSVGGELLRTILGVNDRPVAPRKLTKEDIQKRRKELIAEVTKLHPGFRTASSVVIHHFGMNEEYENWKSQLIGGNGMFLNSTVNFVPDMSQATFDAPVAVEAAEVAEEEFVPSPARVEGFDGRIAQPQPGSEVFNRQLGRHRQNQVKSRVRPMVFSTAQQRGNFAISQSQRNATALFGAGLIDVVPDEVLEAAAKKKYKDFPEVSGRVARLPDGKIGRFGWKAQKATLRDFTVTACAVELGLHVPEHPQSGDPNKPDYKPAGYDLTRQECDALVDYIGNLPAPAMRDAVHPAEKKFLEEGQTLLNKVGCTTCHTENLGDAEDIFSDLLVHDLGPELGDTGSYGVFLPDSPGGDDGGPVPPITELTKQLEPRQQKQSFLPNRLNKETEKIIGATRLEWRTPPLWGVRDSSPYLHDGRAKTLEEAIAMHGGEASRSAQHFFGLEREERQKVIFFLKSLAAPAEAVAKR